jgi:signal transduction histidine kinase
MRMDMDPLYSGNAAAETEGQLQSSLDPEGQIARLRTLQKISCELNSRLDVEEALVSILDEAIRAVGAERGCLLLANEATNELELRLSRHLRMAEINGRPFRFSRTVIERVWQKGEPVLTANAVEDPELTKADSVIKGALRSILCVPLHVQGQRIGVLYLDNRLRAGQFQGDDLALVVAIADQAAIALRNARLHQEVVDRASKQMEVLQHIHSLNQISLKAQGLTNFLDLLAVIGEELEQFGYRCAIALLSPDKRHLKVQCVSSNGMSNYGIPDYTGEDVCVLLDETVVCQQVLETRTGRFVSDLSDVMVELLGHPAGWVGQPAFVAPLVANNRATGLLILGLDRNQVKDASLLMAFANQVAATIEISRLHAMFQQQLAEMQSVLAITRAMVSEVSVDGLLGFIMAQAEHLTAAQGAAVLLLKDDGQSLEVAPPSESWLRTKAGSNLSVPGSLVGLTIDTQQVQVINNVQDDNRAESVRALLEPVKLSSLLCAPLVDQGESLGVLLVWNKQEGTFTAHDSRLMGLFADEAALALRNAQLYEAARQELAERRRMEEALLRHNRELELLNQASQAFNSTLRLNQVLATVLEGVRHLLDVTACSIWLIDPETSELICRQTAGPSSEVVRGRRLALGEGIPGWVASSGERQVVHHTPANGRFSEGITQKTEAEARSLLCVPLRTKRGVVGVIYLVDARVNHFGSTDLRWVEALAASAASAIENAQLYSQIRQLAAENERQRLARELHDTVTQSLYSIGMAAQTSFKLLHQADIDKKALDAVEHILALSQTTLSEMRERLHNLHPTALADRGLIKALAQHCNLMSTQYLLSIEFKTDLESPFFTAQQEETLYYIAREALWNVVKYAGATRVKVSLAVENKQIILSVVDDGTGFDASVFVREETMGLRNMKQRAQLLGGTLGLETKPGYGTRIKVRIPAYLSEGITESIS